MVHGQQLWTIQAQRPRQMSKKPDPKLEALLQKILNAKGRERERESLIKILKNKYPDAKVPK